MSGAPHGRHGRGALGIVVGIDGRRPATSAHRGGNVRRLIVDGGAAEISLCHDAGGTVASASISHHLLPRISPWIPGHGSEGAAPVEHGASLELPHDDIALHRGQQARTPAAAAGASSEAALARAAALAAAVTKRLLVGPRLGRDLGQHRVGLREHAAFSLVCLQLPFQLEPLPRDDRVRLDPEANRWHSRRQVLHGCSQALQVCVDCFLHAHPTIVASGEDDLEVQLRHKACIRLSSFSMSILQRLISLHVGYRQQDSVQSTDGYNRNLLREGVLEDGLDDGHRGRKADRRDGQSKESLREVPSRFFVPVLAETEPVPQIQGQLASHLAPPLLRRLAALRTVGVVVRGGLPRRVAICTFVGGLRVGLPVALRTHLFSFRIHRRRSHLTQQRGCRAMN
mmetsp:Transcript_60129/g.172672  ORF Transcript_60129/g.172672 Transcript_60129/m.172672 type:complete len:398 (+) Transcript_60129:850-2043(+)